MMSFTKFTSTVFLLVTALAAVPFGWAQTYTVLYSFTGAADGAFPAALIRDSAGNLYGTTIGAEQGGLEGSVYKLNPKDKFKLLYSFEPDGAAGARPGGLVEDSRAICTALLQDGVRVRPRSSR